MSWSCNENGWLDVGFLGHGQRMEHELDFVLQTVDHTPLDCRQNASPALLFLQHAGGLSLDTTLDDRSARGETHLTRRSEAAVCKPVSPS